MNATLLAIIIGIYFFLLLIISLVTGRKADNLAFFLGNRRSPWYIVAFGMIGASLSGVTFISIPGWVGDSQFSYMQLVLGYLLGYAVIANVLLPLYYRLKLTSIYTYLETRFGRYSYKTGASFFLLSRIIGSSFRLYLVANVLYIAVFQAWNVPFWLTVIATILLIWLYTNRGGIRTIIWTDTLQTTFMLVAVVATIIVISRKMDLGGGTWIDAIYQSDRSRIFFFENLNGPHHFLKQFFSGAFIAIVMTGLDQDMMQKNLSCRNLEDAKKNMYLMSFSLVPVNLIFLSLGALLYLYAAHIQLPVPEMTDDLYPIIATRGYLPPVVTIFFILGLVAAAYSSADSALTALTTSFTVDILEAGNMEEKRLSRTRRIVHVFVSLTMVLIILAFRLINDEAVISAIFKMAGYTYGPLLGLYAFGLFFKKPLRDRYVPYVAIASPLICIFLNHFMPLWAGYYFGFEILILNGMLTFTGLLIISKKKA